MIPIRAVNDTLLKFGWSEIRRHFREDSCIATTKVIVGVLTACGYQANPCTVRAVIQNRKLVERIVRGEWDGVFREGEYSIGIGFTEDDSIPVGGHLPNKKWAGHLIAVGEGYLYDLSIVQASRPQHHLTLYPSIMPLPPGRESDLRWEFVGPHGMVAIYERFPDIHTYQEAADWTDESRTRSVIQRIVNRIKLR